MGRRMCSAAATRCASDNHFRSVTARARDRIHARRARPAKKMTPAIAVPAIQIHAMISNAVNRTVDAAGRSAATRGSAAAGARPGATGTAIICGAGAGMGGDPRRTGMDHAGATGMRNGVAAAQTIPTARTQ